MQTALDLLKYKNIRLVNIRPDEIVDGNPKLTLGLIWTIILHFQVKKLYLSPMNVHYVLDLLRCVYTRVSINHRCDLSGTEFVEFGYFFTVFSA